MKLVETSASHSFLTLMESLRDAAPGWVAMHFACSRLLPPRELLKSPDHIPEAMDTIKKTTNMIKNRISKEIPPEADSYLYVFEDGDLILLVHSDSSTLHKQVAESYRIWAADLPGEMATYSDLDKDNRAYQKLADMKLLAEKRVRAYHMLADKGIRKSLPARRKRRQDLMIMIVEDDRFTASYTLDILHKEYECLSVHTGEEALIHYLDHAPDIVLLDIHLPGISGHDLMTAIRSFDEEAYVIMMSVDTESKNVVEATKGGATGFLKKPFSRDRLLGVIRKSPLTGKTRPSL